MGIIDLFALLLIAGVAYAMLNEGIYGALIVLVLSVLAGVIALNFYGPVATALAASHVPFAAFDRYGQGVFFLLFYGGSLLGLRALFDHFLTEKVRFPVNIDRIGAAAIGLCTGVVTSGAFIFAAQMMPLNKDFLGYDRERAVLGIAPDGTFLNLMAHISRQVLERSGTDHLPKPTDVRDCYYYFRIPVGSTDAPAEAPPATMPYPG
jgi:hypothetical protein